MPSRDSRRRRHPRSGEGPQGRRRGPVRRILRFCWRFARTFACILILVAVAVGIHLHNVGLPEPLKQMLLDRMRQRGWEIEYARLRVRWMKGIVGEDLHFRPAGGRPGPQLFVEEVDFRLSREDLEHFILTPESLTLRNGRCIWVLAGTNGPRHTLALEHVQGLLRYQEPDLLELAPLSARLHGLDVRIEGRVANALHLRSMKWPVRPTPGTPATGASTEQLVHAIAARIDQCRLGVGSSLNLSIQGNARDTNSLRVALRFELPAIESPWLNATNVKLSSEITPPPPDGRFFQFGLQLQGEGCRTPWGSADDLKLEGTVRHALNTAYPESGHLTLRAAAPSHPRAHARALGATVDFRSAGGRDGAYEAEVGLQSEGLEAPGWTSARDSIEARFSMLPASLTPLRLNATLSTHDARVTGGAASNLVVRLEMDNPPTNSWSFSQPPRLDDLWERARRAGIRCRVEAEGASGGPLFLSSTRFESQWTEPQLRIEALEARLNRGVVEGSFALNVSTRQARATITNTSDIHLLNPLFKTNTQAWLARYGWTEPPWVTAEASITLPAWGHFLSRLGATNPAALPPIPWKEEALPTFRLDGRLKVAEGNYMGAPFSSADLSFHGSNEVWWLPDIVAHRPEGTVELAHFSNDATGDYWFHVRSRVDPAAIAPLLSESGREALKLFRFGKPPLIEGDIWGRWRVLSRLGVSARVEASDLGFRGETASRVEIGGLRFTNRMFVADDVRLTRPEGTATVSQVWFHLDEQKVRLTNVVSEVDIPPVCRAIGPKVAEVMNDYEFGVAPRVRLNGVVDTLKRRNENDLHFDIEGHRFHWKLFNLPEVTTHLDWVNDDLDLLGFDAGFYGGRVKGEAHFDFSRDRGTDFRFGLNARGVSLHGLMEDISTRSNKLEGILSCDLVITNANTRDKFTWFGSGHGELTNGLIWDIPVFAVISPAFNAIIPGMGNSRARQAVGTFIITNGVIHTADLDIRASGMRMKGNGTVDFDKRLNARLEAELLRDMPGIGFLISKVLYPITKLFEFKITGTLDKPRTDQLYMVPRILLAPFHPIRTIKDLFPGDSKPPPPSAEERKP
jgi:hypothetical protein